MERYAQGIEDCRAFRNTEHVIIGLSKSVLPARKKKLYIIIEVALVAVILIVIILIAHPAVPAILQDSSSV